MAVATLSLEGKLAIGLHGLGISLRQFVEIAKSLDEVSIGLNSLSEGLSGRRRLSTFHLEKFLALKNELVRVRTEFSPIPTGLPMDWSNASTVKLLIFALRCRDMLAEESEVANGPSK